MNLFSADAHRDQDAVRVLAVARPRFTDDVRELLDVVHVHDVDVVVEAESLDEGEVNLQRHIPLIMIT